MTTDLPLTPLLQRFLLQRDPHAGDEALRELGGDLIGMARTLLSRYRVDGMLSPHELINEAIQRLLSSTVRHMANRGSFLSLFMKIMNSVLADRLERRRTLKRGGQAQRISLSQVLGLPEADERPIEVLDLRKAIDDLECQHGRPGEVALLHGMGGLSVAEVALRLEVSTRTVSKDWAFAKSWLHRALGNGYKPPGMA